MARLYANENFPLPVVQTLRDLGHNVLTIQEAGDADQALPDELVLAYATGEQRAVLTINRKHFVRLHRNNPDHAGIVVCSFDADFERQAQTIHAELTSIPDLTGKLLRINRPQT